MKTKRRFEILLPLKKNNGDDQLPSNFTVVKATILSRFGGVSMEPGYVSGEWRGASGLVMKDHLMKLWVDVDDCPVARGWFAALKPFLKDTFEQEDIYMTSHLVEVI